MIPQTIFDRIAYTLELLTYPYPIEVNTIKNLLAIVANTNYENIDLSKLETYTILYISRMLKKGEIPPNINQILGLEQHLVAGYSPEDEVDWIVKNAKKKEEWIPIIVGPCVVV